MSENEEVVATVAPTVEATVAAPTVESAAQIVERWFNISFPGSILGNSIEMWNFVVKAKEDLKTLLANR